MKKKSKIFLLLLLLLNFSVAFAQKYYDDQWKKVTVNSQKGIYKSSLPIILDIQKQAMKENNTIELIKGLKEEFIILNQVSDDENNNSSSKFFAKIKSTGEQLKGDDKIFFTILISTFVNDYFQQNFWKINQRTNINNPDVSSIESWSKLDFKNYLLKFYNEVDGKKGDLKKISFQKYKEVFNNISNADYFLTLYDWYAQGKINFLGSSNLFTKNELTENKILINTLYDELIASNTGNSKLYFSHQKINENCEFNGCKNQLEQLQNLVRSDINGDYKVVIYQNILNFLIQDKKQKEALILIENIKKEFPKSLFLNNIKNIENEIVNPFLYIGYEKHTQPNIPIHFTVKFKNITNFNFKIYKIENGNDYISYSESGSLEKIKKKQVRKEDFHLNDPGDYLQHISSLEIKPLPAGIYIVEYNIENDSAKKQDQHFYFLVSDNKIIYNNKSEKGDLYNQMKLVNADNGQILKDENIIIYEYSNDKKLSETKLITDNNGAFMFPTSENKSYYRNYLVYQPKSNSYQDFQIYGYERTYNPSPIETKKVQVFTDRAIYRPGQTVYFKAINTQFLNDKESVVSGLKQKIILYDTNNQEVASQELVTNEFGSYHGSFILPKGKLNGSFRISTSGTTNFDKYIQVEEYKRPKFEVTFEPIKGEYKYGQTLELKGKAMMFSGVALSTTKVNYEIKKNNIRWRYFSWFPNDYGNENSILGEVKTDEKGEFIIKIDLKKDEKLEGIQIDNFAVNASVTDINGETQSANTNVKVASVSHYIKVAGIKNVFDDENVKLKIETPNYNEQNLKKSYHVKLSKLQSLERIFRNNFKEEVQDLPQMSKYDFVSKFPHDRFDNNDDDGSKISSVLLNGVLHSEESLDLGRLQPGSYELELFNVEGKDTIKTTQNFAVFNKKSVAKDQNIFLEVIQPKTETKRGESFDIYIYSSIPNALVNVFVQNGISPVQSSVHQIKDGILKFPVIVPQDKKISNLNFSFQIVAFNDVQTQTANFAVVDAERDLKIETVTFRDKIEPNSKEKWSVKVSGSQKESINAEVLANMYDMSLDQFYVNRFVWDEFKIYNDNFKGFSISEGLSQKYYRKKIEYLNPNYFVIPQFSWRGLESDFRYYRGATPQPISALQGKVAGISATAPKMRLESVRMDDAAIDIINSGRQLTEEEKKEYTDVIYDDTDGDGVLDKDDEILNKVPVRQNLNETAFFYPDLKTDSEGNVSFEFTSPEALTKWKLMFLAHTKDARAATLEKEVVTQKEFSVTPNYPRFLREGDELNFQSKLSNLTNKKLNGFAQLQILDAFTNEDISEKFGLSTLTAASGYNKEQAFSLDENGNTALTWKIKVPNNVSSIIFKVVAKAGQYSDGEQKAVAILPNRMLVTDALPIFVKEGETKTFELENLKNATSTTISNVSNTLELTTNPIWEIMFALPSLKNDQNNSADVTFNKWFADVLASEIFKANPKMKTVFEEYQNKGLLNSNLEKNQELKQLLLEETPWVLESKNESEQMQKLSLLFDVNTMRNTIQGDWDDFKKLQNPDGGFSWYQGYPSSYSTSLYILKNLGKINVWLKDNAKDYQSQEQKELVENLIKYIDNEIGKYWDAKKDNVWSNWAIDYLDTRNYWEKQYPLKGKGATLKSLVKQKAKTAKITDFTFFGLHRAALLMNSYGLKDVSNKLMTYLKETSVDSKTQGVYWKQNLDDWGWFSSKVVNQAGALEAFSTLKPNDQKFIEDMKIWLITQKEVNSWGSSRGTSEVIFTILNSGKSWTGAESDKATIVWGGKELKPETQATGYVKSSVKTDVLDKNLATVTVTKPGPGIVQGGLFWQYYEDLDKIKSSENYISVTKELYKKIKTVNGDELQKISPETPLKVGDKVTVRMILNTDRSMEFIHIKDMRAAGFEPVDVLSGYQWKNNLGYYQSTKDASTNFYIQYMPKGKYVFEYDYVANASGKFSNGITTMQNYYAPQMNSHTKGTNVQILE